MRITLIASTELRALPDDLKLTPFVVDQKPALSGKQLDRLAQFAGRACYQAWNMPNPDTANDAGYLANIIKQGHFSVLEHASATFYIEGVSRSLTHELVRHRHLSYSQLSQRYVEMKDAEFITPPALKNSDPDTWDSVSEFHELAEEAKALYEEVVDLLMLKGLKRKQAREAARAILPNNMETRIVVTGNMRAWRDMLFKRYSVHADAEIREMATEILCQLKEIAPGCFQDFPSEPFE